MTYLSALVAALPLEPVALVLLIPAIAVPVLALVSNYRLSAALNTIFAGLTFAAGLMLLAAERVRGDFLIVDDFNIFLVVLTTFVGFTTSVYSASYIGHEIDTGHLTPGFLRFYHAMYQAMMGAMNLALVSNNIGLMWVGLEVATLATVMMVGLYRTHEAIEAAWKYFILGSVGIGLAFFGTILIYMVASNVIGGGVPAMAWDTIVKNAGKLDPKLLSLAFVFLLVGYGTKAGLAPFHAWLPDAHAEGPTPISAVLSGLLLNVALYALLRFKMVLAGNAGAVDVGAILMTLGLVSLVFAALMLYRRRDIKRLFAYSSIEHIGVATFAFGLGGPLANFAGLLHMTMHSLVKSAIFFAVGHVVQAKNTQRIADIGGLSVTHPVLAVGFALGVIAIVGLPPFGVFTSEFLLVSTAVSRHPLLTVILVAGLLVALGALLMRLQGLIFGEPSGKGEPVKASYIPLFVHLALALAAGLWLPEPLVRWFRGVAALLG